MPVSKKRKKKPRRNPPPKRPEPAAKAPRVEIPARDPAAFRPHKSIDLTKDGECSRCGNCCSSILCVTEKEKAALEEYAEARGLRPDMPALPKAIIYMMCPFLDQRNKACLAYDVRPEACRCYSCARTDAENARRYLDDAGTAELPSLYNMWELFGKTGIRSDDGEITTENANRAVLVGKDGATHPIQVGRPLDVRMQDGRRLHGCLCLGIMDSVMQVFHDGKIETLEYEKIKDIKP